jgi:hypothetical protein
MGTGGMKIVSGTILRRGILIMDRTGMIGEARVTMVGDARVTMTAAAGEIVVGRAWMIAGDVVTVLALIV